MKKGFLVSDDMLNAFVDNELESNDHEYIIRLEELHPEIKSAIIDKRRLKILVKTARIPEQSVTPININRKSMNRNTLTIAASIVLMIVVISSFLVPGTTQLLPTSHVNYSLSSSYRNTSNLIRAVHADKVKKIIFHLNTSNNNTSKKLLADVEALIVATKHYEKPPQIEVIATGEGINILTTKTKRSILKLIQSIHARQPGVTFIVCRLTFKKLQHAENNSLELLQKTMLVKSGKKWIQDRKQQGWSYIAI